ncbi:MAG: hypothetical protein EOM72_03300 [Opitutae bacterium]|nr:hypothetical protein [Opitutae bacterium]
MMKWQKRGLIFNPAEHDLGADIVGFAQGPQALVFDDFVRIYFSARKRSPNGKFVSCIRFADFDKSFQNVIGVSPGAVMEDGKLGAFDEHGIFPMNVLRVEDLIFGYTCGWSRRASVCIDMGIGLAISKDQGLTFKRVGDGPVLTASLREPFLIGDPFVTIYEGSFHMWYIFGVEWKRFSPSAEPDRIYKIGHAVSADGQTWHKEDGRQIIADKLGSDESQALPTVIKIAHQFHMFFCYRESSDFRKNAGRGYRIGHALSTDLENWARDDSGGGLEVSDRGWDSEMICYPHVFKCDKEIYLLYNGNEFGRHGFGLAKLISTEINR